MNTTASTPTPNVLAGRKFEGSAQVMVSGVSNEARCSRTAGLRDICVVQLNSSLEQGLTAMLDDFFDGEAPAYLASFKLVELSHDYACVSGGRGKSAVHLSMKWQFVIEDNAGNQLIQLTGRTEGREALSSDAAHMSVKSLLDSVLEDIGAELNQERAKPGTVKGLE